MHFEGEALTWPWLFIFPFFHRVYVGIELEVHLLPRNKEHRCFKVLKQVIQLIIKVASCFPFCEQYCNEHTHEQRLSFPLALRCFSANGITGSQGMTFLELG